MKISTDAFKIIPNEGKAALEGKQAFKIITKGILKVIAVIAEFFGLAVKVSDTNGQTLFHVFKGPFQKANDLKRGFSKEDVLALIALAVRENDSTESSEAPAEAPAEQSLEASAEASEEKPEVAEKKIDDAAEVVVANAEEVAPAAPVAQPAQPVDELKENVA